MTNTLDAGLDHRRASQAFSGDEGTNPFTGADRAFVLPFDASFAMPWTAMSFMPPVVESPVQAATWNKIAVEMRAVSQPGPARPGGSTSPVDLVGVTPPTDLMPWHSVIETMRTDVPARPMSDLIPAASSYNLSGVLKALLQMMRTHGA